jgi:hypothetical protein
VLTGHLVLRLTQCDLALAPTRIHLLMQMLQ